MEKLVSRLLFRSHLPIPAVIYLGDMLENVKSFKCNSRAVHVDNDGDFYVESKCSDQGDFLFFLSFLFPKCRLLQ